MSLLLHFICSISLEPVCDIGFDKDENEGSYQSMLFLRSFVCIILIATDKVITSWKSGEKGCERKEIQREYESRWAINDKRKGKVSRESWTSTYTLVYTYTLHAYDSHKSQTSTFIVRCNTATREDTCSRRKTLYMSYNENKRVWYRSTWLIKNRSYQFARESRREKREL